MGRASSAVPRGIRCCSTAPRLSGAAGGARAWARAQIKSSHDRGAGLGLDEGPRGRGLDDGSRARGASRDVAARPQAEHFAALLRPRDDRARVVDPQRAAGAGNHLGDAPRQSELALEDRAGLRERRLRSGHGRVHGGRFSQIPDDGQGCTWEASSIVTRGRLGCPSASASASQISRSTKHCATSCAANPAMTTPPPPGPPGPADAYFALARAAASQKPAVARRTPATQQRCM